MQSTTPMQPYGRCNGYHRPRPKFAQAVTAAPAPLPVPVAGGRLEDNNATVNSGYQPVSAKALPSRPANHLQQQHTVHSSKSFDPSTSSSSNPTPIHQKYARVQHRQQEEEEQDEELLSTRIEVLQDEVTYSRPPLTSKFSFDNLTAMDSNGGGNALKKMATRAWLQGIAQAARNSTYSQTASTSSSNAQNNKAYATRPGTPNEQHQLGTSPERPSKTQGGSFLHFRRDGSARDKTEASRPVMSQHSSSSSNSLPMSMSTNTTRSQSPTKQSRIGKANNMIISNPELVHPAHGGMLLNTHLGEGARVVGVPAEAFTMIPPSLSPSSHRIYQPPASPPPRRSEDSIRSLESSSSTTVSFGSTSTTSTTLSNPASCSSTSLAYSSRSRQDRALPYLPLRIKNSDGSRVSTEERREDGEIVDDVMEQLVPTPGLPPESAKYIFNSLYSREQSIKVEETIQKAEKGIITENEEDVTHRFGDRSALTRSESTMKKETITISQAIAEIASPTSPAFARISPLTSTRRLQGDIDRPCRSSGQQSLIHQMNNEKPFHAMLLQPVPVFPPDLSDDEKLVNVHVGGSKVFTTRLSAITSHPDSHIAQFITSRLKAHAVGNDTVKTQEVNKAPIEDTPEENTPTAKGLASASSHQPHMVEQFPVPAHVTLHLPTSPINALRSARASIFNDVPSDESCEDSNEPTEAGVFGNYASVTIFREKLDVPLPPFPNPAKGGMRFTRFTNLSSNSVNTAGEANITASSSEYASTEMEDESALGSFLDTTPDEEEPEDPFHLQGQSASPMPCASETAEAKALKQEEENKICSDMARESHYSDGTHSPSSSPNSSAYKIDSPILPSTASSRLGEKDAFQHLITQHEQHVLHPLNLYLDRSADPYDAVFHWLRNGVLPHRLRLDETISAVTANNSAVSEDSESIQAIISSLPAEARKKILPLVLHPIMAEVKDLRDEASYLGFSSLASLCEIEINKLRKAIRWSTSIRNAVAHPGLHTRSESEGGVAGAASPGRLMGKFANRPRPRLVGHRHYDSESKVLPRATTPVAQDNWI